MLANERRRDVLSALAATDATATVDALVDRIPASDAVPNAEPTDAARESVRTRLRHVHLPKLADVHLPKLADAHLVEYDPDSRAVAYELAETAEALLGVRGAVGRERRCWA